MLHSRCFVKAVIFRMIDGDGKLIEYVISANQFNVANNIRSISFSFLLRLLFNISLLLLFMIIGAGASLYFASIFEVRVASACAACSVLIVSGTRRAPLSSVAQSYLSSGGVTMCWVSSEQWSWCHQSPPVPSNQSTPLTWAQLMLESGVEDSVTTTTPRQPRTKWGTWGTQWRHSCRILLLLVKQADWSNYWRMELLSLLTWWGDWEN